MINLSNLFTGAFVVLILFETVILIAQGLLLR
jgi:hypothetical protein